jgi:hypothetical protein
MNTPESLRRPVRAWTVAIRYAATSTAAGSRGRLAGAFTVTTMG